MRGVLAIAVVTVVTMVMMALGPAQARDDAPPAVERQAGEGDCAWILTSAEGFDGGLAASPDGQRLAAIADEWLFIIEATTGRVLHTAEISRARCNDCAWAPDGRRLAVATRDGILCVDATTGTELWRGTGHPDDIPEQFRDRYRQPAHGISDAVAWNGDGTRVATTTTEVTSVRLLDGATGAFVQDVELGFTQQRKLASTPDGSLLLSVAEDGPIAAINWPDASVRWKQDGRHEPALAVSADSRWIACGASGGSAGTVIVRGSGDGAPVGSWGPVGDFDIGGVAFNADATAFIAAGGGNGLNPLVYWRRDAPQRPTTVWHKNYPI